MCLHTVEHVYKRVTNREVDAWGAFKEGGRGELFLPFRNRTQTGYELTPLPTGGWIKANGEFWRNKRYPWGFHKYAENHDPYEIWPMLLIKVRLRKLVACGTEFGKRVYVAQEMFIPKQRKAGRPNGRKERNGSK